MTTKQQQEALTYFTENAARWNTKASLVDATKVNVIQQRNNFARYVVENRVATQSMLDVGCGTGDLVCELARMDVDSIGIDFAPNMIAIARAKAAAESLVKASFECSSIFDFDLSTRRYDLVVANGFIEYISFAELDGFLDLAYRVLNPGGSFVLGSRNRLFNIFSGNSFTLKEIDNGHLALLLKEAVALASGDYLTTLAQLEVAPLQQPDVRHAPTGVDVATRYQFTPGQLSKIMMARHFTIKQLYPVHIHGVPVRFKDDHPDIHASISNLLQYYAADHVCLVPYSSSFMLHAQKEEQD